VENKEKLNVMKVGRTMKIEILGSGGAVITPKPFCSCGMCEEALIEGGAYNRTGPSVFLHDANILFDTPEDSEGNYDNQRI
jgi:phosphoribosyl 1,2-cyclic phosphate phosphodiesterase